MFKTELEEKKQSALILTNSFGKIYLLLKKFLEKKEIEVYTGRANEKSLLNFDYVFFINPSFDLVKENIRIVKKALVLFSFENADFKKIVSFLEEHKVKNIKVAGVSTLDPKDSLERALWFFFSSKDTIYLPLVLEKKEKQRKTKIFKLKFPSKKLFFLGSLLAFFFYNFLIWIFLFVSFYLSFKNFSKANDSLEKYKIFFQLSKSGYEKIRPVYHFFFLGSYTDRLINVGEDIWVLSKKVHSLRQDLTEFFNLSKKPIITFDELEREKELLKKFQSEFAILKEELLDLQDALPKFLISQENKEKLNEVYEFLDLADEFFEVYDRIFPIDKKKKYLIFFANNMELRPGGGFIGSFAILKTRPLGIEEIKVYDVYDADGQLKFHIEPPEPIKKYLNQPHWFLRDSNFSPDLAENYEVAKKFLKYELGEDDYSGLILITTSAVKEILKAFGEVYLPDYEEKINAENFYIKTQFYVHNNFFPGALNKKKFLFDLLNQLLVELENVDTISLVKAIKTSLDEKNIVLYFEDKKLQAFFDRHYWSGRVVVPRCFSQAGNDCILDYIFPVDANLGVNKANFYVKKKVEVILEIKQDGKIKTTFVYTLRNDSPPFEKFLGGEYKNYFRLFLLRKIDPLDFYLNDKKNDFVVYVYDSFKETNDIGYAEKFFVVKPGETAVLRYSWINPKKLKKGSNIYQLIVQKQIGGVNYDFSLKVILPENAHLVNQNFTPVVKEGFVIYNTYLSSDKIFFLEIVKE